MSDHHSIKAEAASSNTPTGTFFDVVGAENRTSGSSPPRPPPTAPVVATRSPRQDIPDSSEDVTGSEKKECLSDPFDGYDRSHDGSTFPYNTGGATASDTSPPPTREATLAEEMGPASHQQNAHNPSPFDEVGQEGDGPLTPASVRANSEREFRLPLPPMTGGSSSPLTGYRTGGRFYGTRAETSVPSSSPFSAQWKAPAFVNFGSIDSAFTRNSPGQGEPVTPATAPAGRNLLSSPIPITPFSQALVLNNVYTPSPGYGSAVTPSTGQDPPENWESDDEDVTKTKGQSSDPRKQFQCRFDDFNECKTGQFTMDLARKTISDHFGRNKAATRLIKDWPLFCRKHYQRATYKTMQWQKRKCVLINEQLDTIEQQFPGCTYNIILKKSETDRWNGFLQYCAKGHTEEEALAKYAPKTGNRKNYEAPVLVLGELNNFTGPHKTKHQVQLVIATVQEMLEKNEVSQVPSMEFVPELDGHLKSAKKGSAKKTPVGPNVTPQGRRGGSANGTPGSGIAPAAV